MTKILKTLRNSLPVILVDTHAFSSLTVMLLLGVGSRYESIENNGISHFLEHMAFKGSEHYPSSFHISSVIEGMGGAFNAFTSKDHTVYYMKAPKRHFSTITEILSQMILHPKLDSTEIENEKGVIVEEIKMYEDMPSHKVSEYFDTTIFAGNPLSFEIAGTPDGVRSFTRDTFSQFMSTHYHPVNATLVIAGGLGGTRENPDDPVYQSYFETAEKYFGSWKKKEKIPFQPFQTITQKPQINVYTKKTEQSHFCLGYHGIPFVDPRRHVASVLGTILGGGMSSRLFMEVREKRGLCYYISSGKDMYQDTGSYVTQAGVTNDKEKINEALRVIISEQQSVIDSQITDEEVERAKNHIAGRLLLSLEDSYKVASFTGGRYLFEKDGVTPEEIIEKIIAVTKEEVISLAKYIFSPSKMVFTMVGPFSNEDIVI